MSVDRLQLRLALVALGIALASCFDAEPLTPSASSTTSTTSSSTSTAPPAESPTTSTSAPTRSVQPSTTTTVVQGPPEDARITAEPRTVRRRGQIRVTGMGFCPLRKVIVYTQHEGGEHDSPILASVETDAQGRFATSGRLAREVGEGRYQVVAQHEYDREKEECVHYKDGQYIQVQR